MVYTIGTRTVTDEGITVRLLDTALVNRTLGMIEAAEVCPSENITASAMKVRVEMLRGDELSVLGGVVGGGISASFLRLKL